MKNKKRSRLIPLVIAASFLLSAAYASPTIEALVKGNNAFALELYQKLKDKEGNIFFSPYSVSTALAMTYAGARDNTAAQMAEALHFTLGQQYLHPAFASLEARLNGIQEAGSVLLNVANSLWPQQGYPFLKAYLELVKKYYGVTVTPLDYQGAAEEARNIINRWVEEKTRDRIKNLIQPGILNALTRLVLVNAIYFKGNWANRFDESLTRDDTFFLLSGKKAQAPLMTQQHEFKYGETDALQVLELAYDGEDLSMIVLLPKKKDGLPQLERSLTAENLTRWTSILRKRKVKVFLPRFKMTSQFRLDQTLAAMGMADAFNPDKANFAGMDGRSNWLYIGAVIHKAFVDVNEEGTEAAAATAVVMRIKMARPSPPPTFRADHPFLFLVRDSGSILFIGRVANPA
jgi:serpin B